MHIHTTTHSIHIGRISKHLATGCEFSARRKKGGMRKTISLFDSAVWCGCCVSHGTDRSRRWDANDFFLFASRALNGNFTRSRPTTSSHCLTNVWCHFVHSPKIMWIARVNFNMPDAFFGRSQCDIYCFSCFDDECELYVQTSIYLDREIKVGLWLRVWINQKSILHFIVRIKWQKKTFFSVWTGESTCERKTNSKWFKKSFPKWMWFGQPKWHKHEILKCNKHEGKKTQILFSSAFLCSRSVQKKCLGSRHSYFVYILLRRCFIIMRFTNSFLCFVFDKIYCNFAPLKEYTAHCTRAIRWLTTTTTNYTHTKQIHFYKQNEI